MVRAGWPGRGGADRRGVRDLIAVRHQQPGQPAEQFVQRAASPAAASGNVLKTATIGGTKVVTNAKGFTVYSFAPDTATKSNCNGSCATYWPPVKGPATAGAGVTGKLGTITRSDGSTQATYNGHPLYTYVSDSAPGQDKGNGLNLSGGVWHVVPVSGGAAAAATAAPAAAVAAEGTRN